MATTLEELEKRVAALERLVVSSQAETATLPEDPEDWTREDVIAYLRSRGIQVSEPTDAELALAAEWDALSEEDKQAHRDYMDSLNLDPSLSQIIIENRR